MPYPDYEKSAAALDYRRLGKQRVETLQIMNALLRGHGWVYHPVTKMWRGYEWELLSYQQAIVNEWVNVRGYKDTCWEKTRRLYFDYRSGDYVEKPPWLGYPAFHRSHQSNLVRKDRDYYRWQFKRVPDNLPYVYPDMRILNEEIQTPRARRSRGHG